MIGWKKFLKEDFEKNEEWIKIKQWKLSNFAAVQRLNKILNVKLKVESWKFQAKLKLGTSVLVI